MKLVPLLLSASMALLFPVHGFSPSISRTISFPAKHIVPAAPQNHIHARRHQLDGQVAFASPSRSRLFFTPKEDSDVDDDEPFIRPALHNSPFFRSLAILYALLFAIYQGSSAPVETANALNKIGKHLVLSPKAAATVHLLSFATWFGTVVYTTFVAGITMFKNLPRRVFGKIQSKLFPLYFQLCSVMVGVQVIMML